MAISLSSAILISEVEPNPEGTDFGEEWVELYSSEEINLSGLYLENNDGDRYNLTGIVVGYWIVQFEGQWLDNSNESVSLKNALGEKLSETDVFDDPDNDGMAWSLCGEEWAFKPSTKGIENNCTTGQNGQNSTREDPPENITENLEEQNPEPEPEINEENSAGVTEPQIIQEPPKEDNKIIVLNSPKKQDTRNSSFVTKQENFRLWIVYSFSFLCVLIIIFISFRKL